jgi:hypothetical protein
MQKALQALLQLLNVNCIVHANNDHDNNNNNNNNNNKREERDRERKREFMPGIPR